MKDWAHRHLDWVIGGFLCLAFAVSIYALSHANSQRRSACADLEALKTITRNEKQQANHRAFSYLHRHPHGAPGIPRALIVESIQTQKKIIKQLAPKDC